MPQIKIISAGPQTTVQDYGRPNFQQFGMPESGAMDTLAFRIANLMVRNPQRSACLEATFAGPEFVVLGNTQMAVSGGQTTLEINGSEADPNLPHLLNDQDHVKIGMITKGCRICIAFQSGIDVPVVLGSKSTYLRGKIGGFKGRALHNNDVIKILPLVSRSLPKFSVKNIVSRAFSDEHSIRVIAGPEVERFEFEALQRFLTSRYTISNQSDRMGCKLEGLPLPHKTSADITSSGISNGAIQVPGNGLPIVLLADRQTSGGYTRIANIISADLPAMGQVKPGDRLHFEHIHLDVAHQLLMEQESMIQKLASLTC